MSTNLPSSLTDKAYQDILDLLGTQAYGPDAKLPSENTLAERFGVSRPIVRHAIARLRAEGRLYARRGSGTYVGDPGPPVDKIVFGSLQNIPDIRSFLDFRSTLESESAARAARRRDPVALEDIRACSRRLEQALDKGEQGIEEDFAFHVAIARASGNRFFLAAMLALTEQTRFGIQLTRSLSEGPVPPSIAAVRKEHAAIEAAIVSGDPDGARRAMNDHLHGGMRRLFGPSDDGTTVQG
jgi:GntR family transcriptional regulator, transcriptional repressor for pyruvate dehydrogenase complex